MNKEKILLNEFFEIFDYKILLELIVSKKDEFKIYLEEKCFTKENNIKIILELCEFCLNNNKDKYFLLNNIN